MKTKEEVYQKMLELYKIGVKTILKHSFYKPGISFEFTEFPTPEEDFGKKTHSFNLFFYVNDTYDDMYDRMCRFLDSRQEFLINNATNDFISLLNNDGLVEYMKKIEKDKFNCEK
jgi:hypothetical protein